MIDRRTIGLINGEVDGVNSPEESEFLRQTIAHNPEARELLEDLKKLERSFSSISPVNPPAKLKRTIMHSIHERPATARAPVQKSSLFDYLFPTRPIPRLGFVFSGGVLAGILLVILYFAVADRPSFDSRDASGALFDTSSESFQTVENATFASEGVQGRVVTEYSGTVSVLRVSLTMKPDLAARFVFNPDAARLNGVSLAEGFPGTLTQSHGQLEVGNGGGTFKAFFAPVASSPQEVRLQIVSSRTVVYERALQLGKVQ